VLLSPCDLARPLISRVSSRSMLGKTFLPVTRSRSLAILPSIYFSDRFLDGFIGCLCFPLSIHSSLSIGVIIVIVIIPQTT